MNLDVFNGDAFSMHSLTDTINKLPHKPMRLGELGLFQERGVRTVNVDVEEQSGRLTLIQSSERGAAPADILSSNKRTMRTFRAFHFERDAKVYADEVQGIRQFGSETELQSVQALVEERLAELIPMHEVTLEYHRVNAVQGILLDADGSTLKNLFTEFGVSQQTSAIALNTTTTDVREAVIAAKRLAEAELGGAIVSEWRGFCGAGFFDKLTAHSKVRDTLANQESLVLRSDIRNGFLFAGVTWEEYRGSVSKPASVGGGSAAFFPSAEAFLVPVASPSIFVTRFAPADYEETVNTLGLPMYAKQAPDPSGLGKYRTINSQSNPICLNLRPRAVVKLTIS